MRTPAALTRPKPRTAKTTSFPSPVGGWIKNQNLVSPKATLPNGTTVNGAFTLENWLPIATGVRMRGGSDVYQQIGDGSLDVVAMFSYVNGNNKKLFATTTAGIYDITTQSVNPAPVVGSLTAGDWSVVQFATPGGTFLRAVNGADTPQVFDGTSWATTPAITGVTATSLSQVFAYAQRLFFIQEDSLNAWYLPAASIGGAAVELPLGGVFTRGGSLLFGASWSLDGGGGLSEQCIFVTTEGEVAVYQGTDPSTAATWNKVGVYRIGKPLGAKAWIHAGGDLVIATDIGFVPLSQAVQRDYAALSPFAVSYQIETAWNDAVGLRSGSDWHCEVWPTQQMVLIALPTPVGQPPQMFVANARTGAWGLYTGWQGTCLQLFGDRLFFGSIGGNIIEAEVGGTDQGAPYTATCVPAFDPLKAPASLKTSLLMRAILRSPATVTPQLSLQSDYVTVMPPQPDALMLSSTDDWGVGVWGMATWGAQEVLILSEVWQSVGGSGYAIAPGVQITSGSISKPNVELVQVDLTYEIGDIVS